MHRFRPGRLNAMKTYFINLDRSPDRLAWFRRQGEALGLDLVRVSAVDARDLGADEIARLRARSSGNSELSPGEIACLLSHRKVWQMLVEGTDEWAFIAEDDIHFAPDTASFLTSSDWIPAGAEIIKVETNLRLQELSRKVWGVPFDHELRRLHSEHFCAGGYILSRSGAGRLIRFTEHRCEPVDVILFSPLLGILSITPILQLTPAICLQNMYVEDTQTEILESDLQAGREVERRERKRRKTTAAKLRREARRIALQAAEPFRRLFLVATGRSVFRKVPFGGGKRS